MKKFLKDRWLFLLTMLLLAGTATAGAIKTWSSGEILTSTDLNTTMSHIHNNMVGGHGARLLNADVASNAAIAHSKLATPALVPKAWAASVNDCAASPCTLNASSGVTSVTRGGAGLYTATWTSARADALYAVTVSAIKITGLFCTVTIMSATNITFVCIDSTGVATDSGFSIMMMDNL